MSEPTQKNVFDRSYGWSEEAKKILEKKRKESDKPEIYHTSIRAYRGDLAMTILDILSDRESYTTDQIINQINLRWTYTEHSETQPGPNSIRSTIRNLRENNLVVNYRGSLHRITDKGYSLRNLAFSQKSE